jgi:hypothetical protein
MISTLLAVLAIFSRKKHVRSKLIYSPAYSYEHVEEYDAITYDGSRIKAEMAYLYPLGTQIIKNLR